MPCVARTQATSVRRTIEDLKVKGACRVDQLPDRFGQQHGGERARFGNPDRLQGLPAARCGDAIEELDACQNGPHRVKLQPALLGQEQQIFSNLLFVQFIGRGPIMFGQSANRREIGIDGLRLFPIELQILNKFLGQGSFWDIFLPA